MGQKEFLAQPLLNSFYERGGLSRMKLLRNHKLLLLLPAVLLSSIFIGIIPLKAAHRWADDCPFCHGKQVGWINPCPFRSVTTNDKPLIAALSSPQSDHGPNLSQERPLPAFDTVFYTPAFNFIPLRC